MNEILIKHTRIFICLFFVSIAFLLFFRLDHRTLHLWDEARLAVNSASMMVNNNYFYTNYLDAPDFWNTKPHLLILLQVLSMKLFGFTEGSIRLPSAVATLLSCGLVFHWIRKESYQVFYACLATLAFICTKFLIHHGARAGDYEALLMLWQLSYCYAIFEFIQTQKIHYLWLGFVTLTLAVLTKGIAGVLFVPGIIIFAVLKNKTNIFLTCKSFYIGSFISVLCIAGYYWIHNILTPGYLHNVYLNEIGERYFNTLEGHTASPWLYLQAFSFTHFYFLPIWLIGVANLLMNRDEWSRNHFLRFLSFSRNFGHQIPVCAGLDIAKGEAIVIIDGDLQDPPELIPQLYQKHLEGFNVVYAKRELRKGECLFKLTTAKLFYRILSSMTSISIPLDVGDFRLIDRKVLQQLQKMLKLAIDGLTSFSDVPLKVATILGMFASFISCFIFFYALFSKYILQKALDG